MCFEGLAATPQLPITQLAKLNLKIGIPLLDLSKNESICLVQTEK